MADENGTHAAAWAGWLTAVLLMVGMATGIGYIQGTYRDTIASLERIEKANNVQHHKEILAIQRLLKHHLDASRELRTTLKEFVKR